jgi:hypothetical protein
MVGTGSATITFLVYDRAAATRYTFDVMLSLGSGATAAERDAVRAALRGIDTVDGIRYDGGTVPGSFTFRTRGRGFDCGVLDRARALPAVDGITVSRVPRGKSAPETVIHCD